MSIKFCIQNYEFCVERRLLLEVSGRRRGFDAGPSRLAVAGLGSKPNVLDGAEALR